MFARRECFNVAQAATVEIPRAGVMGSVLPTPKVIGRQYQHADDPAHPVVCHAMVEECAVPAVVLDHEQPYQKARGRHRDQQREPPEAQIIPHPGQPPERHERPERDCDLDDAAGVIGLTVACEDFHPASRVGRLGGTCSASTGAQDRIRDRATERRTMQRLQPSCGRNECA